MFRRMGGRAATESSVAGVICCAIGQVARDRSRAALSNISICLGVRHYNCI